MLFLTENSAPPLTPNNMGIDRVATLVFIRGISEPSPCVQLLQSLSPVLRGLQIQTSVLTLAFSLLG